MAIIERDNMFHLTSCEYKMYNFNERQKPLSGSLIEPACLVRGLAGGCSFIMLTYYDDVANVLLYGLSSFVAGIGNSTIVRFERKAINSLG